VSRRSFPATELEIDKDWITDRLTIRTLAIFPTLGGQVTKAFAGEVKFMEKWAIELDPSSGIREVTIHAWTPNKLLTDYSFTNGMRFADDTLCVEGYLPVTAYHAYDGRPLRDVIDHEIFDGIMVDCSTSKMADHLGTDLTADITIKAPLSRSLEELLARERL